MATSKRPFGSVVPSDILPVLPRAIQPPVRPLWIIFVGRQMFLLLPPWLQQRTSGTAATSERCQQERRAAQQCLASGIHQFEEPDSSIRSRLDRRVLAMAS
jgi:hypothetical protein